MHPDSSYHKWDNSDQVELTVQGASRVPGRGGKALCLSKFAQGKAKVILYVLLAICIAVATALIVVNLGKLSKGLAEAQVDRDTIRRDAKRNLSHHQDYLELKMSKEFNVFNSRLLNMSNELAGVRLGIEEIQADHMKDQSHLQDAIEIRNLTHSMPKERAEVRRDHDRLQEVLSRMQDELRNITEVICTKCPPGWQHFEKKCYFFSTSTKSWSDAKQFCTNEGSDLVIVNTKQEQRFLSNQIMEPDVYWLGLSDSAEEGEWRWVDGSPLSVRFWASGEPNNVGQQGEDCGSFRFNGKWNDATCSLTEHWICERQC
ncbi:C-type lectin domain family 4 member M-like isoform X2 [Mauremys reevesii]|uniref:C-type lectin domain family 4 member M-like isoform X2 n=1 Tax=Mauremys reevesii TaxID=260615 RepID=UPI00193EDD61|nr:C-type lectin domain family 4 member M-like isoform X2 [Mauremys reevesii]